MRKIEDLVRRNIASLSPYKCARDEFGGDAAVFLDANENPYNSPYNRYPDPLQRRLKQRISLVKGVPPECMFLGNGSDEAIDLCYRVFCEPGEDNVVAISPTYGMYRVAADINNVEYRPVPLEPDFSLNAGRLLAAADGHTKLVFLCTPNNPTANALDRGEVAKVINGFDGLVVIDEAYSDFSKLPAFRGELQRHPNIIVLNTFSKAWGCAAIRLGMAFASAPVIGYLNKVKYPYNVNALTQAEAEAMLARRYDVDKWVGVITEERARVMEAVAILPYCSRVYPSDANFFLARFDDADRLYRYLAERGIVVRNRSRVELCGGCLRITVGSQAENSRLLAAMRKYR